MKWETNLWSTATAENLKKGLEQGDIIGLQDMLNNILTRSNLYRDSGEDKGPYWRDLRKISALVTAAIQLNPIVVETEFHEREEDSEFHNIYFDIMMNIHDYLDMIINQEVK